MLRTSHLQSEPAPLGKESWLLGDGIEEGEGKVEGELRVLGVGVRAPAGGHQTRAVSTHEIHTWHLLRHSGGGLEYLANGAQHGFARGRKRCGLRVDHACDNNRNLCARATGGESRGWRRVSCGGGGGRHPRTRRGGTQLPAPCKEGDCCPRPPLSLVPDAAHLVVKVGAEVAASPSPPHVLGDARGQQPRRLPQGAEQRERSAQNPSIYAGASAQQMTAHTSHWGREEQAGRNPARAVGAQARGDPGASATHNAVGPLFMFV